MRRSGIRSISEKRKAQLKAKGPTRRAWINRTTKGAKRKPLAKSNPERQAKRRKAYAVKLAAYKRSETYKLVEARAEGRCEAMDTQVWEWSSKTGKAPEPTEVEPYRCYADRRFDSRLTHHHKTYARFGGKELPKDVILLCDRHNELYESQHPTRNRNYR